MSRTTNEINKITGAIIAISSRLIIFALVVMLLYEGVTKAMILVMRYSMPPQWNKNPARIRTLLWKRVHQLRGSQTFKGKRLIANEYSFIIQAEFFDYKVNPVSIP